MKRIVLALGVSFAALTGFAQTGNNQIGVGAEVGFPTGDAGDASSIGFGGTVKGLYGIGEAGQITFTTGFLSFSAKKELKDLLGADKISNTAIPLLAGYRHNFNGFFAEPQVGYTLTNSKVEGGIVEAKESGGAFTWAVGAGYVFNKTWEAGVRYQSMHKDGASSGFVGLRVGYNFSLGGK